MNNLPTHKFMVLYTRYHSFLLNLPNLNIKMQYSISNTRRHSTFDLANLPLELRLLIFEEYFKSASSRKWNGKNLSLIKALRGNPMLYHEALNIFYLKATFVLTVENANRCIIRMSPKLLRTIRSIRLELKYVNTPRHSTLLANLRYET